MADLTITDANVVADSSTSGVSQPTVGTCGPVALTPMMPVYQDGGVWKKADANGNATRAQATAVTLNSASPGQPVALLSGGGLNPGATVVVGKQYVVSHNSGKVAPVDDLITADYVWYLGFADTASHLVLNIGAQGALVQKP